MTPYRATNNNANRTSTEVGSTLARGDAGVGAQYSSVAWCLHAPTKPLDDTAGGYANDSGPFRMDAQRDAMFRGAGLLIGLAAWCTQPAWAGDDHGHRCLVVDTDVATDDFRAFAALFPHVDLRAVVVTEGISSVPRGSMAIVLFLASGQSFAPVIPGLAAAAPPMYDWLPGARAAAETINGLLKATPRAAARTSSCSRLPAWKARRPPKTASCI